MSVRADFFGVPVAGCAILLRHWRCTMSNNAYTNQSFYAK
jgi:hypothetical protein